MTASRDLVALMLAGIAGASVLTASLANIRLSAIVGVPIHQVFLMLGGMAGLAVAVGIAWMTSRSASSTLDSAQREIQRLRRSLQMTEAVVRAEPQILIFWEPGQALSVVTNTLTGVPGLPESQADLLRFGSWLEPGSANDLKIGLDGLFGSGRPLNLLIKTLAGGHLEAEGRASGSRAVLRFRDVAGYRADLVRLLDQHQSVSRSAKVAYGLLDALPFPVWFRGSSERITWANTAYARAVEARDSAEVVSRQLELLESKQRAQITKATLAGQPYTRRMQVQVDGDRRAHDVIVRPLDGITAAAAVDVAARESAEGEIMRQISAFARTLDRVDTAIAIFDGERRLTFYNEAWRSMWDLDQSWLSTKPEHGDILDRLRGLSRLPGVIDYKQWKTKLLSEPYLGNTYEEWWHFPGGRTLRVFGEPRPDGGVTYLYDDATERLKLESRYNALIRVQRETLDSLKEGVAVFGTDGRLRLYNKAFLSIWRLSPKSLEDGPHIDKIIAQARVLHDEPAVWTRLARTVTAISDKREGSEGQLTRPDDCVIDYAAVPLPDGATLITFSDVTAVKQVERALMERNEALVAADKLKNQFIGHVSYELRTPLTNIIGFGELLSSQRTGGLNDKQREYLGDILGSSKALLSIIDDILDLATIDAGALELKQSSVSAKVVTEQAVMGVRDRAARARIKIEVAVPEHDVSFMGDESRIRQMLYNLASNAIGFSRPGGFVRIAAAPRGDWVEFTVTDDGVGIPKDQLGRIFDRFESRSASSGRQRGTGLGLSLVKSLVDLHGGELDVSSEPGRGTRVTVRLPKDGAPPRHEGQLLADCVEELG